MRGSALVSLLLLPLAAWGGPLERFYAEVQRMDGQFEQRLMDEDGETLESYRGRFSLARPDKFRWQYESPYELDLGSDGEMLWHHDVDLSQITIRDAGAVLTGTPAELLGGDPARLAQFEIDDLGESDGLHWFVLRPRHAESDFDQVRLGLEGRTPREMSLRDRLGQITHMRFGEVTLNAEQPPGRFLLELPEGVTVVDDRARD